MQKVEKEGRQGSVAAVAGLALSACCRRKGLLQHFGERRDRCDAAAEQLCDFCRDPRSVVEILFQHIHCCSMHILLPALVSLGEAACVMRRLQPWQGWKLPANTRCRRRQARLRFRRAHRMAAGPALSTDRQQSGGTPGALTGVATHLASQQHHPGRQPQRLRQQQ